MSITHYIQHLGAYGSSVSMPDTNYVILHNLDHPEHLIMELSDNIVYKGTSSQYNWIGESPNWVKTRDDKDCFDQSLQTYTCPRDGSYEIRCTCMPDTGWTIQVNMYVEISLPNGDPYKEYILEYSQYAYHRNGTVVTPRLDKGSTIRIRWVIINSGNHTFRGFTYGTGFQRAHNHFSIIYRS